MDKILMYLGGGIITLAVSFMSISYQARIDAVDKLVTLVGAIRENQAAEIESRKMQTYRIEHNENEIRSVKDNVQLMRTDLDQVRGFWTLDRKNDYSGN